MQAVRVSTVWMEGMMISSPKFPFLSFPFLFLSFCFWLGFGFDFDFDFGFLLFVWGSSRCVPRNKCRIQVRAQTLGSVDQADDRRSCQRSRSPLQLGSGDGQLIPTTKMEEDTECSEGLRYGRWRRRWEMLIIIVKIIKIKINNK